VRLAKVDGCTLHIEDVDIADGTPLLDIKPYVPELDVPEVERIGWLTAKTDQIRAMKADERFK
jgi:tRNA (Thr-GGU) A37 N-methylase